MSVPAVVLAPAEGVDIEASIAAFGTHAPGLENIEKDPHDLQRYLRAISRCEPDVLIEVGAGTGASANWFAERVDLVISVDIDFVGTSVAPRSNVVRLQGSSVDPRLSETVWGLVGARRRMVCLDSEHTAEHVTAEIGLWIGLVSVGCYLVIEDGIFHYRPHPVYDWDPLVAITRVMPRRHDFYRDAALEGMYPVTGSPAGWWRRAGQRAVEVVRSDLLGGYGRSWPQPTLDPVEGGAWSRDGTAPGAASGVWSRQ